MFILFREKGGEIMNKGIYSKTPSKVCFFSSSGCHVWSDAIHVSLTDGKYSEVSCMNSGCVEVDRIYIK